MDLDFLETFLVVADSGSIAEAARRTNLTPAAVAQRIHSLENELGATLLLRAGRTVAPTSAGQAICQRARELVRGVNDLRMLATSNTMTGVLRIGAGATAITGLLPVILGSISRQYQQLEVYVEAGTSLELYERVLNQSLDVAVIVEPRFEMVKACAWQILRREPLLLIVPEAMRDLDPHTLLKTMPFIRYDRKYWGGQLADLYLRENDITPTDWIELDALDAIAVMVSKGLGISIVPDWAPPWPEGLRLRRVALDAPHLCRNIGALWMRNSINIQPIQAFIAQARSHYPVS